MAVPYVEAAETSTEPVTTCAGDTAIICIESTIVKLAVTPPNLTVATLVKLAPFNVTVVPPANGPVVGLIL